VKIAIFGGAGDVGRGILEEALARGHTVTASLRTPAKLDDLAGHERLTVVQGDATDEDTVAAQVAGHDGVINSVSGVKSGEQDVCARAITAIVAGMRRAGVKRLLNVGTAGTLEVEPGVQRMDAPGFPEFLLGEATAQRFVLNYLRDEAGDLDWTYISPPVNILPGERRGSYRITVDELLIDDAGESRISIPDYSDALLDELEDPQWIRRRFTLAY
jgi:putative NADH-flavin reductase